MVLMGRSVGGSSDALPGRRDRGSCGGPGWTPEEHSYRRLHSMDGPDGLGGHRGAGGHGAGPAGDERSRAQLRSDRRCPRPANRRRGGGRAVHAGVRHRRCDHCVAPTSPGGGLAVLSGRGGARRPSLRCLLRHPCAGGFAWLDGLILAMATVGPALRPGPLVVLPSVANPLGASGMAAHLAGGLLAAAALLLPLAVAASVGSLIVRLRRARGAQRQQLKWFASAAALVAVIAIPVLPAQAVAPTRWADAGLVVLIIAIACLPVSAGIAILRYRLFDIDVLLNRALVYSTVTSMLGAGYAGMVLGVGPVLGGAGVGGPRGGQGGGSVSSFAVALATLAVAAMFQPARRWVQDVVDRRFNRRRYNAQRTVEAFAAQLRQQTDLDALVSELIAVVDRTVEPTQVSLWLRPTADGRSRAALLIGGGQ